MAPRPPRRRRDADDPTDPSDPDGDVDLGAAEHAWWAQRDINGPWSPHPRPAPPSREEPGRDILADHFGADWRTSFGFDRPDEGPPTPVPEPETEPEPTPELDAPVDTSDPYAVLGVDPSATWEAIVGAHRSQARRHHPDRLLGRAEVEVMASEERIRDINVAYQELRVRRGK